MTFLLEQSVGKCELSTIAKVELLSFIPIISIDLIGTVPDTFISERFPRDKICSNDT